MTEQRGQSEAEHPGGQPSDHTAPLTLTERGSQEGGKEGQDVSEPSFPSKVLATSPDTSRRAYDTHNFLTLLWLFHAQLFRDYFILKST